MITEVNIPIKNLPSYWEDKTIVQITDLHLRDSNQVKFLEHAIKKIQDISPNIDFSFVKNLSIDSQISGHTHGGQFFPFSLMARYTYKCYEKGLHRDGNFSVFVSTGLGTWGPPVRTFVPPEIAVIHLKDISNLK